jgi:hypothetical protein
MARIDFVLMAFFGVLERLVACIIFFTLTLSLTRVVCLPPSRPLTPSEPAS